MLEGRPNDKKKKKHQISSLTTVKKNIAHRYNEAFDSDSPDFHNMLAILADFSPYTTNAQGEPPMAPMSEASFQGGGRKGDIYPACLGVLEENGYLREIKVAAGASAGAITAFILGLGFNGEQIKRISAEMNFLDFTDIETQGWGALFNGHKVGVGLDLIHYGAAFKGLGFHQWASAMIEQILGDPNATFADLHEKMKTDPTLKAMVFKATRYNAKPGERIEQTFSYEETPNIRIADAVRASMAFPGAFAPWQVKDKEGNLFGVFADGGILNNNPVDVFGKQAYFDRKYKPIEKQDHRGGVHQINPCVVAFSLTDFEDLDDNITPYSPRIRGLKTRQESKTKRKNKKQKNEEVKKVSGEWRFNDILNAILWNTIGVPVKEEVKEKHALYNEQTVQLWPDDVGTLEFDAPSVKIERLASNGREATQLWLDKFRDPTKPYKYPEHFDDSLTKEEKSLRRQDPDLFYHQKLVELFTEFHREMTILKAQQNNSDERLFKNIKLRYLTYKINELRDKMAKNQALKSTPDNILEKAFKEACRLEKEREKLFKEKSDMRWNLIDDDKLVHYIGEKIAKCGKDKSGAAREEALRLLRGQLSNIIPLIRVKKGGNLLSLILQVDDPVMVKEAFNIINNALSQCYYQGREEDTKFSLAKMLNELAHPPIFSVLALHHSPEIMELALNYGANPYLVSKETRRNGFQEMIVQQNYEGFKMLVQYCVKRKMDVHNLKIGNQSLGHYLILRANQQFLEKLNQDPEMLKVVFNYQMKNKNQNTLLQEAARVASSPTDLRWHIVAKQSMRKGLQFAKMKAEGQANFEAHNSKWLLAKNALNIVLEAPRPDIVIKDLKAEVCLNILKLTSVKAAAIKLFELAQDPTKADILIALCEKAYSNPKTSNQLKAILQEKINGENILHYAARYGNVKLIKYLRKSKYDIDVNRSGPIDAPCAILQAAKAGESEAVIALMESVAWGFRLGYHPISRRVPDDPDKKTALHYLALTGSPEAFCSVLFGARGRSSPTKIASIKDRFGNTPLHYIIEHNRMDILQAVIKNAKGKNRGLILSGDYYFADIFGWKINDPAGYPDLELAKRINPDMYHFICDNLSSDKNLAAQIIQRVEAKVAEDIEKEKQQSMRQAEEIAKFELSLFGESPYDDIIFDDWTLISDKAGSKKLSLAASQPSLEAEEEVQTKSLHKRDKIPPSK